MSDRSKAINAVLPN